MARAGFIEAGSGLKAELARVNAGATLCIARNVFMVRYRARTNVKKKPQPLTGLEQSPDYSFNPELKNQGRIVFVIHLNARISGVPRQRTSLNRTPYHAHMFKKPSKGKAIRRKIETNDAEEEPEG
jgi:hypothetical protein